MGKHFSSFFFERNYILSFLNDKILLKFENKNVLKNMKFFFLLKNLYFNRIAYYFIVMLLNKFLLNSIYFVYSTDILKRRFVKVGGYFLIGKYKFYHYLIHLSIFSIPKFFFSGYSEYNYHFGLIDNKNYIYDSIFFSLNKLLFLNFFQSVEDYNKYYRFFEKFNFRIKLKFISSIKFFLLNRDIFRLCGLNVY